MEDGLTKTLPEKFVDLRDAMDARLVERTRETLTAVTAIISGTHHFQLGSPGTAKSLSVRTLVDHIDFGADPTSYFEVLMTKFSTPEEVFGPVSVKGLENDVYRRQTDGYLPTSKFAFVDEIFKANSSVLNALLWIMNERKFRNDGQILDVPLVSLFCASNELPQGEELDALYDRIHFRHIIRPIQEPGNFVQMLKGQIAGSPGKILTIEEILQARDEAKLVVIPEDVLEAMNTLRSNLRKEGIEPTDRRFNECLKIIRATAWLADRATADIDDMKLLRHVLWTSQDELPIVERLVLELANPLDKEAMDLLEQVEKLATELDEVIRDADNNQVRNKKGIELHGKLERAKSDLDALNKRQAKTGRKSEIVTELEQRLLSVTRTLLKEIFRIEANQ
jgi:MoxR-like ATPase